MFSDNCLAQLKYSGFDIVDVEYEIPQVGICVDAHTMNRHGVSMFWEFKGSMQGDRPGSRRTDTLRKAIAEGLMHSLSDEYQCCAPLILLTSHIPESGYGLAMLSKLPRSIFFDVLNPWNHGKRLVWIANADFDELQDDMDKYTLIKLIERQWRICHD